MDRVLDRLWIGDSTDLDGTAPLAALGFVAVVDLRDRAPVIQAGLSIHHLSNRDGDPWKKDEIERALAFIGDHIRRGRVLVACVAGMSRSASMVIGHLVRIGMDVPSAHDLVKRARPEIAPIAAMLESVIT